MSDTKIKYTGPGTLDLLTVLFVALKLTDVIAWSWWWVLAPTWVPIALVLLVGLIVVIAAYLKA